MKLIDKIIIQAKKDIQTIVLPEGKDKRIQEAARILKNENILNVVVLVNEKDVNDEINKLLSDGINVIVIENSEKLSIYTEKLYELRKEKGMTKEQAEDIILNPIYFGVMMVKNGEAGGMVAGSITSTGDVLRPALQILKTAKDVLLVSTLFLMELPEPTNLSSNVFAFSDCGLVVNPNAEELSEIAIQTARSFDFLTKQEPRVAMLSYSTFGSAKGELVNKVISATKSVKQKYPNMKIDGELQLDAAIIPEVSKIKAPQSAISGNANVLIFPDLQSGNIGYKLVQRFANASAYGPLTQGLAMPVNDLSRGCNINDVVAVAAITAVQSQSNS